MSRNSDDNTKVVSGVFGIPKSDAMPFDEEAFKTRVSSALRARIGRAPGRITLSEIAAPLGRSVSTVWAWSEGTQLINGFDLDRLYRGFGMAFEQEIPGAINYRRYGLSEAEIGADERAKADQEWRERITVRLLEGRLTG